MFYEVFYDDEFSVTLLAVFEDFQTAKNYAEGWAGERFTTEEELFDICEHLTIAAPDGVYGDLLEAQPTFLYGR